MNNTYVNLINGVETEMTDDEFSQTYVSHVIFESDFFDSHNFKVKVVDKELMQYDLEYKNSIVHIVYLNIKNSGMNDSKYKKRFQISSKLKYIDDGNPYYVIGSYNTKDKILYIVVELGMFIKKAIVGKSYSSFWLDYYSLSQVYEKDFYTWKNRNGKIIRGISNLKIQSYSTDDEFFRNIFFDEMEFIDKSDDANQSLNSIKHVKFDEDSDVMINSLKKLKRNSIFRDIALQRENYTCELCGTKTTFKDKNGKEYFDGHHLIMYNFDSQQKYENSLDHPDNIVCLCPTCHKKIHYATPDIVSECVLKLLIKHSDIFEEYDVDSVDEIMDNYLKGVADDE